MSIGAAKLLISGTVSISQTMTLVSVLFRGRGMKRCLAEGHQRFELWVGAAVLANNLMRIATLLTKRSSRIRRAA
jgi:IS5 family transposase